jgi:hypothetical protein
MRSARVKADSRAERAAPTKAPAVVLEAMMPITPHLRTLRLGLEGTPTI